MFLGFAIAAMHYTGMTAMADDVDIHYLPGLFFLSILIAVVASEAALYLALKSAEVVRQQRLQLKIISALVMGAAICGMHYTGMYAAVFTPLHIINPTPIDALNPDILAISIACATFVILWIAFIVSSYKNTINEKLINTARQVGMAEVAMNIMHNMGNILNSASISSELLAEKIRQSKLSRLVDLNNLLKNHKDDLNTYLCDHPEGRNFPNFLDMLTNYWQKEHEELLGETKSLIQNIDHLKKIVSTQQTLNNNAVLQIKKMASIADILDESIKAVRLDGMTNHIKIIKKYEKIKPVKVDKAKLLQVLISLLKNANDAVNETVKDQKEITLQIRSTPANVYISVQDNGFGINNENLTNIFGYGFSSKKDHQGADLHNSANSVKEMGGKLTVISAGLNEGSIFTVELPK